MRWQGCLGVAVVCCLFFVGSAFGANKTVATGLGFSISEDDLDAAYRRYVVTQAVNGISIAPAMEGFFQRQILDDLILSKITSLRANAADRAQAFIQAKEAYTELRNQHFSDTAFDLRVQAMGMTTNAYRLRLQEDALTQEVLKRELKAQTMVKQLEVQEFFNENLELWKTPEYADVEHIVLSKVDLATGRRLNPDERANKQATAAKVLAKARAGVDFAQLAKEFSEDLISKNNGGKFRMYRSTADPVMAEKVFSLRINLPEMVESELGYHILRVMKKVPAGAKNLGEVQKEIREHLYLKSYTEKLPNYVKLLKEQARVKTFLE